mgnify:CR=1 FL=1
MAEKEAKKAKNIHEIEISISGADWEKKLDEAFKKVIKKVKIDGFRPGKAPRNIYEKKYGKESLVVEAAEDSINEAYEKALKEFNGVPIIQPTVNIKKADLEGVCYVFTFTTKPEVKINKYTKLGVKKDSTKVTDKEVKEEIEKARKEYADLKVKEGKIENGDIAIIDYEGFDGDTAFKGGKADNYSLEIGSNTFIPGFEDALIGLKAGDKKDVKLTFPKDYHAKDLAGKDVVFKVTVNEVKTKVYPELNEEFFLDLGMEDVKTTEDFEGKVKESLEAQKEYDAENKYIDELFEALLKETTVDIYLPAVNYTGEIVLENRAVNLYGYYDGESKTSLNGSIIVNSSEPDVVRIDSIDFIGDGGEGLVANASTDISVMLFLIVCLMAIKLVFKLWIYHLVIRYILMVQLLRIMMWILII